MTYGLDAPLTDTLPATTAMGQEFGLMHIECAMKFTVDQYMSENGVRTLGELLQRTEEHGQRTVTFGIGLLLVYPFYDSMFDREVRAEYLRLCLRDNTARQLMLFTFPEGLPDVFYEYAPDRGLHAEFAKDEMLSSYVREFVL